MGLTTDWIPYLAASPMYEGLITLQATRVYFTNMEEKLIKSLDHVRQ